MCSQVCAPINIPNPHACNAIDPHVIYKQDEMYMTFGSFWTGIKMVQLNASSGLLPSSTASQHPMWDVAENISPDPPRPIEASWLEYDSETQWYYLFSNWGMCCRGVHSTYNIRVGRSKAITGPFLDKKGKGLTTGGGSLLLGTEGEFIGPGQVGLLSDTEGGWIMSMHYYNGKKDGAPCLRLMRMKIGPNDWPRLSLLP